ncbi:transporter substrate-binding domain-containing protein [Pseudomonas savastanoi]|uniref:Transporter substrate-binding domain-containing protein n=1 Tax=Pseudomonas savastanoi TaxID=29438 RepID=A0AAW5J9P1_PSESS|nr:sensor histidine kinase [Pseudomonas savastanoi]MCQ3022035.1 transporter substrate-binding domain-containing protein [Pseudomonas savastanoi]
MAVIRTHESDTLMIGLLRTGFIGCLALLLMVQMANTQADEPQTPEPAQLSSAQRSWLDQHGPLRIGLVLRAPYAQFDQRLQQLSGANVDLMNALASTLPVELLWRNFPDQAALEKALANGEIDVAPGLMQTPAGLRLWLFSDPYLRVSQLLIGERDGSTAVDLEKLDSFSRVAVRMPGPAADYLRSNFPHLNLQGVPLERQALQLLLSQQARYAVVDEAQLSRLLREPEFAGLAIVGDIGLPQLLRVASRRDMPELAAIVSEALRAIPAKELEQLHARWMPLTPSHFIESTKLWKNLCILLLVMLLACFAIVVWQRRQQQAQEQELLCAREELARRVEGEEALRLAQFSIDQSTVGILWVNWDSRVRYANRAAESMLGYAPGQVVERPLIDFEPGLHMDRWLNLWKNARSREDSPQVFEAHCLRADGSLLPADVSLSFLRFHEAEYLVVFLSDASERRRAHDQLRELSAHLDSMKRLIAQLFQLVRDVATALRPPILDAGIASAIEWQARRFEARTQIPCLVQVPDNLPVLSDARATGMFRILQEALTNVMRHAQAHTVEISLTLQDGMMCMSIADDGQGFVVESGRVVSFGLVGMRERVLMLGGRLELDSDAGEGTTLRAYIPLDPVAQERSQ